MILDEYGYKVFAEPWKPNAAPIYEEKAPVPVESHIQNFIDCVKSREAAELPGRISRQGLWRVRISQTWPCCTRNRRSCLTVIFQLGGYADDAFDRAAGGRVQFLRHPPAQVRQPPGDDCVLHRFGHFY